MQRYNNNPVFKKKTEINGYHLLKLVISQKELCAKLGISLSYAKHLPMFEEFIELQRTYDKKTYIYKRLSEKYGMHTSSVRRVISNMLQTVAIGA